VLGADVSVVDQSYVLYPLNPHDADLDASGFGPEERYALADLVLQLFTGM
jgi:hypothetical protein